MRKLYKPKLRPWAKRRLLKLAKGLEQNAANKKGMKFDLDEVINFFPDENSNKKPGLNCNTVGCAIGLAAISGMFAKEGFKARFSDNNLVSIEPVFKGKIGFTLASRSFFGLNEPEHNFLFTPDYYKGEQKGAKGERNVAKRIRNFVEGKYTPKDVLHGVSGSEARLWG